MALRAVAAAVALSWALVGSALALDPPKQPPGPDTEPVVISDGCVSCVWTLSKKKVRTHCPSSEPNGAACYKITEEWVSVCTSMTCPQ